MVVDEEESARDPDRCAREGGDAEGGDEVGPSALSVVDFFGRFGARRLSFL